MNTSCGSTTALESKKLIQEALDKQIQSKKLEIPLLPQVASRLLALSNDPNADAEKLSALIHQDQSLAGQVLRIANSPAYLPRTPIVSLQQAVAWLGISLLTDLAFTVSIQQRVFHVKGYEADIKQLRQHSLASGVFGKEVARLKRRNVEGAFLCGLLHSIGKPIILRTLADLQQTLNVTLGFDDVCCFLEDYHTQVGTMIAETWELPGMVRESIACYDRYAEAQNFPEAVMITHLAGRLAATVFTPSEKDVSDVWDDPVLEDLNLYPDETTILLEKGGMVRETVESMLV